MSALPVFLGALEFDRSATPTTTFPAPTTNRKPQHFNFTPEVGFVKRVVEGLIETEYLRRTPERRDWVDYVA